MAVLRLCILGLALLLIGSCGQQKLDSSGLDSKSIEDAGSTTTALAVSSTTPDNGSTSVSRTASIVVNFNKSIYFINSSNTSLESWDVRSTSSVPCNSSEIKVKDRPILISKDSYSNCLYANGTIGSSSITIDLKSALDSNTTYKVKVLKESLDGSRKLKDASDGSGTQMSSDYEFSFTTGS